VEGGESDMGRFKAGDFHGCLNQTTMWMAAGGSPEASGSAGGKNQGKGKG